MTPRTFASRARVGSASITSCACPGPSSNATSFGLGSRRQAGERTRRTARAARSASAPAGARCTRQSTPVSRISPSAPAWLYGPCSKPTSQNSAGRSAAAIANRSTVCPSPTAGGQCWTRPRCSGANRSRARIPVGTNSEPSARLARVGSVEREPVGGGTPVVVDAIGVGAGREQAGHEMVVAALHGDVERCRARERGRVRIRARVEEVLDHRAVAADGCRPQR